MSPIRAKDILRQLKADLIGKDSYRGVTLTYSWLANQVGHFALGFIPTIVLYFYLVKHTTMQKPIYIAPMIVSAFWFLFELWNVLGPLATKRKSTSPLIYMPRGKYVFPPAWGNLVFDTFTDLCFFWLGACAATLPIGYYPPIPFIAIGLIAILMYPIYYWYVTKMYMQSALYPFQFRLAQFATDINATEKVKVYEFLNRNNGRKHLLIFGSNTSGTTGLAVGIATEKSIRHHKCTYTTTMKLFAMCTQTDTDILSAEANLWTWRTCSFLLIDDINPGSSVQNVITPQTFLAMITTPGQNNTIDIANKSVIWVMGKDDSTSSTWLTFLQSLGISPQDILVVDIT
jgi:hypothetical protein